MTIHTCKKCGYSTKKKCHYTRHLLNRKNPCDKKKDKKTNFKNGKIYVLHDMEWTLIYFGSTVMTLKKRLAVHVSEAKDDKYVACTSKIIIDKGNYKMTLLENFPCNSKKELEDRETYYIENVPDCVNKYRARISEETYLQERKEYSRQYRKDNPEKIKENNAKYYAKSDKEKRNEKNREKINCPQCGEPSTRGALPEHIRKGRCGAKKDMTRVPCKYCKKLLSVKTAGYPSSRHYTSGKCLKAQREMGFMDNKEFFYKIKN